MTTTTALLGALPLCFTPLGVSIVGGLIVSQALTLYTTPIIYHYLDRLGLRLRPGRGGAGCRTAAAIGWRSSDLKRHDLVAPQVAARDGQSD